MTDLMGLFFCLIEGGMIRQYFGVIFEGYFCVVPKMRECISKKSKNYKTDVYILGSNILGRYLYTVE